MGCETDRRGVGGCPLKSDGASQGAYARVTTHSHRIIAGHSPSQADSDTREDAANVWLSPRNRPLESRCSRRTRSLSGVPDN